MIPVCFLGCHGVVPLRDPIVFSVGQDETPLFLAAKEGSYTVCQLLLDHYANRNITDHMDRLPRDMALDRRHHDIVQLMDEYKVGSPSAMCMSGPSGSPTALPFLPPTKQGKQTKRRSKPAAAAAAKSGPISPNHGKPAAGGGASKGKSKKKRGTPESASGAGPLQSESAVGTISPGYPLDSHSPPDYDLTPPPRYCLLYTSDAADES